MPICVQRRLMNCLVTHAENLAKSGPPGRPHGACMMLMNYEAYACLALAASRSHPPPAP